MNAQEIIDLEHDYVLGVYGRAPFVLERGRGQHAVRQRGPRLSGLRGGDRRQRLGLRRRRHPTGDGRRDAGRCAAREQSVSHSAPCPAGPLSVRNKLRRQGAFLQQRRRSQRGCVQVCAALRTVARPRGEGQYPGLQQRLSRAAHGQPGRHPAPQVSGPLQAAHAGRAFRRLRRPGERPRPDGRQRVRHHRRAGAGGRRRPPGHAGILARSARSGRRVRCAADLR